MKRCFLLLFVFLSVSLSAQKKADSLLRVTAGFATRISASDTAVIFELNSLAIKLRKKGKMDTATLLAKRVCDMSTMLLKHPNGNVSLFCRGQLASALNTLGLIEVERVNTPVAMDYLLQSLAIKKEAGDSPGVATTLHNIGLIHQEINNHEKAIECYEKARVINEKLNLLLNLSKNLNCLGHIYLDKGELQKAKGYYQQALDIKLQLKETAGISLCYTNFGNLSLEQGQIADAEYWFRKAIETARQQNSPGPLITGLANMGNVLCKLKKFREADPLLKEAYTMASKAETNDELLEILRTYTKCDSALGHFKEAYTHFAEYVVLREKIGNETNSRKVLQQQMQFEYEQKEIIRKKEQEAKDILTQQQMSAQKTQRNYLLGGLVLMMALILFVYKNYRDKKKSNKELENKNSIIEEKQKEILDSIRYAKRIQNSIITSQGYIERSLKKLNKK